MKFTTKQELYNYLNNFDFPSYRETKLSDVYFLVEFDDYVEPIYFSDYSSILDSNEDWWLGFECTLSKIPCADYEDVMDFVKETYEKDFWLEAYEYEKSVRIGSWLYKITCFQSKPFLPDEINIIKPMTESECLDWMLKH